MQLTEDESRNVYRYDGVQSVITPLNPIEDLSSWISGLKSHGYVSGILNSIHGTSNKEARIQARLISTYSQDALGFLEQAYSGPPQVSFLPLYYAVLNLAKIYIIIRGGRLDLMKHRSHGASYDRKRVRHGDLLEERVVLHSSGSAPLFYQALTNEVYTRSKPLTVRLENIYPFIRGISFEFTHLYPNREFALTQCSLTIDGNSTDGYYLKCWFDPEGQFHSHSQDKSYIKLLTGYGFQSVDANTYHSSLKVIGDIQQARSRLIKGLRRYLLYDYFVFGPISSTVTQTPVSNRRLLYPEEFPIFLALFHLSNVVRYDPDYLHRLQGERCWPLLLTLRTHGVLCFLTQFWSFLHQECYVISS